MSPFFNTRTLHSLADTHLNFASIRDAGTCFDFDFVNHNQPGGRSWSRSEQEGNVAQVLLSIHMYLAVSVFCCSSHGCGSSHRCRQRGCPHARAEMDLLQCAQVSVK